MAKISLNRQQLNTTNWGSSVNANWTMLEDKFLSQDAAISSLEQEIDGISFGSTWGGFARFDLVEAAKTEADATGGKTLSEIESALAKVTTSTTKKFAPIEFANGSVFGLFLGSQTDLGAYGDQVLFCISEQDTINGDLDEAQITKESRIYYKLANAEIPGAIIMRIVGNWNKVIGATSPYDANWIDQNIIQYANNDYNQLFWNDYIYQPQEINALGELVWKQAKRTTDNNETTTTFPAAVVSGIVAQRQITAGTKMTEQVGYRVTIPTLPKLDGSDCSLSQVYFYSHVNGSISWVPFWVNYIADISASNSYIYVFPESFDLIDDNDYLFAVYHKLEQ